MRKTCKQAAALLMAATLIVQPVSFQSAGIKDVQAAIADEFEVPAADANGRVGALMPYTRYDSEEATLGGGATLKTSKDWAKDNIATQASQQSYVALPSSGAYAEWTMNTTGAGVTMRFTMPDSSDGMGQKGSVDVYVNGTKTQTVDLNSYWMWQYFPGGQPSDTPGGTAAFAFDEVHFKLNRSLQKGDKIRIESSGASGLEYGVDFLEIEEVPEPIEQPANSVSVTDYGANPDDGADDLNAIRQAVRDADAKGMDVYFPEGTYHLSGMWNLGGSNIKITGAGMWYTNLQFTSSKDFGGGIAGGNPNSGDGSVADGYCKNLEFCNMYINSNLRSRYGENAVYKCFMDIYADGSVIHDVWEDHFECGFWFGDYNGKTDYCDGVKVVNCRIRNNLADGVNFCQGTSNATVYNCSIRNNGDDGLAMWNNNYMSAKDETNNVFAYNTIDLIWRAGAIAIYGGSGHKIYNNYICDTFLASGIHLNTTFPGYGFDNNKGITFDNNILVRSGTNSDCWGEDLSAIDIKGNVSGITFNNTQIYDSPFTAIRLMDGYSNLTFNNTKIYGAGLSGQDITYSANKHSGCAIRESAGSSAVFNGLEIANIAPDKYANDSGQKNTAWPFWTDRQTAGNLAGANILEGDVTYEVPSYPTADNSQGGGIVDPLEGITGYNVKLEALAWKNQSGNYLLNKGDKVTFTAVIRNDSNVDIPAGVMISLKVSVDGTGSYTHTTYKDGLRAGQSITLSPTATWTAEAGGHTFTAEADYRGKLTNETTKTDNTKSKKVNVSDTATSEPTYTKVTGRYDIQVLDVTWDKEIINVGDALTFTATIVNAGDQAVPAGQKLGIQFQVDGQPYPAPITWNDQYFEGLQPGQVVRLTATGGNEGASWTATTGSHTVTAWADDQDAFGEGNEANNQLTKTITIPKAAVQYYDSVDIPDSIDGTPVQIETTAAPQPTQPVQTQPVQTQPIQTQPVQPTTAAPGVQGGYDLIVTAIKPSKDTVNAGDQVTFDVTIKNNGDADIPAGTIIGYQIQFNANTDDILWNDQYSAGLKAGESVTLTTSNGSKGVNYWIANNGQTAVMAWVDDVDRLPNEVNENNNQLTINLGIPYVATPQPTEAPQPTTAYVQPTQAPQPTTAYVQPTQAPQPTTAYVQPTQAPQPTTAYVQPTQAPQPTTAYVQPTEAPQPTTAYVQPTEAPQPTTAYVQPTEAPQPTTADVQPTDASQPTTADVQPTTAGNGGEVTTNVSTSESATNVVVKVGATKVKKATKKKAAKKAKITLKKLAGATGYQVAIYKTKKAAKNNGKALVKKTIKKATATIKSKKIKKPKKLFVKARAYVLVNGSRIYGAWSKPKKVKVK